MTSLSFTPDGIPVCHNFVEVEENHLAASPGHGLSSRDLGEQTLIVLHDSRLHRGSLLRMDDSARPLPALSRVVGHMTKQWGSFPGDIEVLLAGDAEHGADYSRGLATGLKQLGIVRAPTDTRTHTSHHLGERKWVGASRHFFYNPSNATVEVSDEEEPAGGRAYTSHEQVVVSSI